MASSNRLAKLNHLVGDDLKALPDRPKNSQEIEDDFQNFSGEDMGGVPILIEKTAALDLKNVNSPHLDHSISLAAGGEQRLGAPDPSTIKAPSSSDLSSLHPSSNQDKRFIHLPELSPDKQLSVSASPLSDLPHRAPLPPSKLHRGQLGEKHTSFCPILALAKYPYKFVDKKHSQRIASTFFDAGKFWNRTWDLYYVWSLDGSKPLFVVRHQQYIDLLADINQALNLRLTFSEHHLQEGLSIRFPYFSKTYPRYLGRATSRFDFDTMSGGVPSSTFREYGDPTDNIPDRTLEAFKAMIEDGFDAAKNKSKALREKKAALRVVQQGNMVKHLKRAQRYLGLRPRFDDVSMMEGMEEQEAKPAIAGIDPSRVAPWPFEQDVVFICVDIEAHERAHHQVTEIGIASLDTRDLMDTPPGKDGIEWKQFIHCRHFRIKEYASHVNKEFVQGCPDRFEFGTSEFIPRKEAAQAVALCFKSPFCKVPNANDSQDLHNLIYMSTEPETSRNIIFLGHDAQADLNYLQQIGYDATNLPNLVEVLDTATMYRVWKRQPNPTKLSSILYDFEIVAWNLHNAGNDAFYTVMVMLAICVREATLRGTKEAETHKERLQSEKLKEKLLDAREAANLEMATWESDDGDDGGDPVKLHALSKDDTPEEPPKQKRKQNTTQTEVTAPANDDPFAEAPSTYDLMSSNYQSAHLWHHPRGDYMGNNPRSFNPRGFGGQRTNFHRGHNHRYDANPNSWNRGRGRGRGNHNTGTPLGSVRDAVARRGRGNDSQNRRDRDTDSNSHRAQDTDSHHRHNSGSDNEPHRAQDADSKSRRTSGSDDEPRRAQPTDSDHRRTSGSDSETRQDTGTGFQHLRDNGTGFQHRRGHSGEFRPRRARGSGYESRRGRGSGGESRRPYYVYRRGRGHNGEHRRGRGRADLASRIEDREEVREERVDERGVDRVEREDLIGFSD